MIMPRYPPPSPPSMHTCDKDGQARGPLQLVPRCSFTSLYHTELMTYCADWKSHHSFRHHVCTHACRSPCKQHCVSKMEVKNPHIVMILGVDPSPNQECHSPLLPLPSRHHHGHLG